MNKNNPLHLTSFSKYIKDIPLQLFSRLIILSFTRNFASLVTPMVSEDMLRMISWQMIVFLSASSTSRRLLMGILLVLVCACILSLSTFPGPYFSSPLLLNIPESHFTKDVFSCVALVRFCRHAKILYQKFSYSFYKILFESLLYSQVFTIRFRCRFLNYISK